MLNRFFGNNTHTYLHILGISGIAFALPWSKVMMSISMMFIVLNLLLEANFRNYWSRLKSNRIYWFLVALYALQLIGLTWSSDTHEALHSIKQQLPFLTIPTVLVAKPILDRKHLEIVFMSFLAPMLFTSVYNFMSYQHWIGAIEYDDIRGMSLSSSHIRYGLLVAMAGAISLVCSEDGKKRLIPCMIILAWFSFYTFYSQVISGVISFAAVIAIYLLYRLWLRKKIFAMSLSAALVILAILPVVWMLQPLEVDPSDYAHLPNKTAEGNPYEHNFFFVDSETGEPILICLNETELEREWNMKSNILYNGQNIQGDHIRETLIRYLASKGLTKDAVGMNQLSEEDIANIEVGRTSANYSGLMARMHSLRFELNYATSPNGHSLLQRFEYWKTALEIIQNNWIFGVGTGDAQIAFNKHYAKNNSTLSKENRRRAHNQYLTYWITFGIFGFLIFATCLFLFVRFNLKENALLALLFISIVLISFFMEDTLETQTGVTFFALFFGIFLNSTHYKFKSGNSVK